MNEELIKQLREEQNKIIPKDSTLIVSRGCGKTYIQLEKMLRWNGYELYCQIARYLATQETLESAHKWINDYVIGMMPE